MILAAVERQQPVRRMSRQPQQQRVSANVPDGLVEVKSKVSVCGAITDGGRQEQRWSCLSDTDDKLWAPEMSVRDGRFETLVLYRR